MRRIPKIPDICLFRPIADLRSPEHGVRKQGGRVMIEVAGGILLAAVVLVLILDAQAEYRRTHPKPKPPTPEQQAFEQRRWDEDAPAWRQRLVHRSWDEKLLGDMAW